MKAAVTAENRPACRPDKHVCVGVMWKSHEYQRGVQVFVILLYEFSIIFLSLLSVVLKELGPVVLLDGRRVLFPVAQGSE